MTYTHTGNTNQKRNSQAGRQSGIHTYIHTAGVADKGAKGHRDPTDRQDSNKYRQTYIHTLTARHRKANTDRETYKQTYILANIHTAGQR